jgi:hypothetical protein
MKGSGIAAQEQDASIMTVNIAYENERKEADASLNPMFGDWQHRFEFAPMPYGDGGAKRAAFRPRRSG